MRSILVVTLALSAVFATSPDACAQIVSVGIKGGLAFTSVEATDEDEAVDAGTAGAIGVAVPITLAPRVRFQPELLFAAQRFTVHEDATDVDVKGNAIGVPLLLSVTALTNGK